MSIIMMEVLKDKKLCIITAMYFITISDIARKRTNVESTLLI